MRKILMFAFLAAFSGPALAQECYEYASETGDRLLTDQPGEVRVESGDEDQVCQLFGAGTGVSVMRAQCGDVDFAFFSAASERGGEHDLLIFMNTVWYRDCSAD